MSLERPASDVVGTMLVFPLTTSTHVVRSTDGFGRTRFGATDQRAQTFQYGKSGGRFFKTRSVMCIAEANLLCFLESAMATKGNVTAPECEPWN